MSRTVTLAFTAGLADHLIEHAGAVILLPMPRFYTRPQVVADIVDFVVARVLDHLGVAHRLGLRWGEERLLPDPSVTRA